MMMYGHLMVRTLIRIFIRSDDPIRIRFSWVQVYCGTDLEEIGFLVQRDYGDLNKAFVTVYGSDHFRFKDL